jgi:phosphomannomutase
MKTQIKFGTDGWRGVIAEDFTFDNVRRVAQATADFWNETAGQGNKLAMVGYDTRFLSEVYAKLVCEVLAANGIKALYPPQAVAAPAVTYAVRNPDVRCLGAVMITASHNPPQFNGYKIKADYAGPAGPELCRVVEAHIDRLPVKTLRFEDGLREGSIELYDPRPAHFAAVKKLVDLRAIRRAKLRVVVDSMHGAGGTLLQDLILGQAPAPRISVTTIRSDRDPLFGGVNPEPIGKNLGALCAAVRAARADIGVATDGDADRTGVVDNHGRYVSIQLVFAMLLLHLLRNRKEKGGRVVRTTNCTVLVDRICQTHGLECVEVPVGFKYICEQMRQHDVLIGGEESGGLGFRGHIPERDGILANLMLLEMLAMTKKSVTQMVADIQREFGKSEYDRIDIHYPLERRQQLIETLRREPPRDLLGTPLARVNDSDGVKYIAADDSWLMFRASGTEPIVRIYSEAATGARVQRLLEWGKSRAMAIAASSL